MRLSASRMQNRHPILFRLLASEHLRFNIQRSRSFNQHRSE
jgi:hypothetical protein